MVTGAFEAITMCGCPVPGNAHPMQEPIGPTPTTTITSRAGRYMKAIGITMTTATTTTTAMMTIMTTATTTIMTTATVISPY